MPGRQPQSGSGVTPAFSGDVPSGRARGGSGSCAAGGAGYAIVSFSRDITVAMSAETPE